MDAGLAAPEPVKPRAPKPLAAKPPDKGPPTSLTPGATQTRRIRLRTLHGSAQLLIDGKAVGATPLTIDVPTGSHTIELKAPSIFLAPQSHIVRYAAESNIEVDLAN